MYSYSDSLLSLADSALILGHRNSEWCGHGPILEQDIALTNIALDLIGQARNFYQYAAELINLNNPNEVCTEDSLAYLRNTVDFKNLLITELPNGDWGHTIVRQFLFSTYQYYLYQQLQKSSDEKLGAIAAKSLKEVTYHVKWSSEWIIRLGDGTQESNQRVTNAVTELWEYTGEMFIPAEYEKQLNVDFELIKKEWMDRVTAVFSKAILSLPPDIWMQSGGKRGLHTEHLGYILSEMQFLQRAYPGCEW